MVYFGIELFLSWFIDHTSRGSETIIKSGHTSGDFAARAVLATMHVAKRYRFSCRKITLI